MAKTVGEGRRVGCCIVRKLVCARNAQVGGDGDFGAGREDGVLDGRLGLETIRGDGEPLGCHSWLSDSAVSRSRRARERSDHL